MTTRVFISYAKEDKAFTEKLNRDLQRAGVNTWLDSVDLIPGQTWELVLTKAITESRYFIAILSSRSVGKKGYVQTEIRQALKIAQEYPPDRIYIIPLRIDVCNPAFEDLRKLQIADLFPDYEKGFNDLLRVFEYETIEKPALVNLHLGRKSGTIKKLIDKGFGFIANDTNDLFFHSMELIGACFDELREGDAVNFEIEKSPKGRIATKVGRA